MVQEIRSLKKLAIFFRISRWGRRGGGGGGGGGGLVRGTLRYLYTKCIALTKSDISIIFLYQTGEKRTTLSYNHGRVVE